MSRAGGAVSLCRKQRSSGAQSWQAAGGALWRGWSVEDGSERHRGGWRSGRKRNGQSRLEEDNDNALGVSLGDDDNDSPSFSPTLPWPHFPSPPLQVASLLLSPGRRRALPLSPCGRRSASYPLSLPGRLSRSPSSRPPLSILASLARPLSLRSRRPSPFSRDLRALSRAPSPHGPVEEKRKRLGDITDPTFFFYHLHMDPHNFFIPSLRIRMPR